MSRARAISEIAAISVSFMVGFAGVSVKISRVLSRSAACTCSELRGVDETELHPEPGEHLGGKPMGAAVDDIGDDGMLARVEKRHHHCVGGRHPGRKTGAILTPFEVRHLDLQGTHRGVPGPGVGITFRQVGIDRFLDIGRRLIDRGQDSTGDRVRLYPGVNLSGIETHGMLRTITQGAEF